MKKIKWLNKRKMCGSLSAYVLIMLGLTIMLYLMGFTNAWTQYSGETVGAGDDATGITTPQDVSIANMMMTSIKGFFTAIAEDAEDGGIWTLVGTAIAIIGFGVIAKLGGQYVLAYLIPIIIFVLFANIFLFPITPLISDASLVATLPDGEIVNIEIILIVIFNVFLLLGIIEFVKGNI